MKYNSVHEYLDDVFKNTDPSDEQIIQAKKQYWKLWFRYYHRKRRSIIKEFTLGFNKKTLQDIKNKKRSNQSTSDFLYEAIKQVLAQDLKPAPNEDIMSQVALTLMQLIDLVEEHIDTTDSQLSRETLQRLEKLERQFQNLR